MFAGMASDSLKFESLKFQSDSFFAITKTQVDTALSDSFHLSELNQLLDEANSNFNDLYNEITAYLAQDTLTAEDVGKAQKPFPQNLIVNDNLHYISYGILILLFILTLLFLFMFIGAKKRANRKAYELYDIDELLEKFNEEEMERQEKLEQVFDEFQKLRKGHKNADKERIEAEENLSFVKVENNKLIEKNEDLQKQLNEKEKSETETINKILELEKEVDALKTEQQEMENTINEKNKTIKDLQKKINDATTSGDVSLVDFSETALEKLEDINLNVAKLEKLNKLRESKTITEKEFESLKSKILNNLK